MEQRQIDFAAWHKGQKRMFDVYSLSDDYVYENTLDSPELHENYFPTESVILLQSTDMEDKNNKPIYEGDIIKYLWGANDYFVSNVEFYQGQFIITLPERFQGITSPVFHVVHTCEVIGNIFENPELLNTK